MFNGYSSAFIVIIRNILYRAYRKLHLTLVFFITFFDAVKLRNSCICNIFISIRKIITFICPIFTFSIFLCPFSVCFLIRCHMNFIHHFILVFDTLN